MCDGHTKNGSSGEGPVQVASGLSATVRERDKGGDPLARKCGTRLWELCGRKIGEWLFGRLPTLSDQVCYC